MRALMRAHYGVPGTNTSVRGSYAHTCTGDAVTQREIDQTFVGGRVLFEQREVLIHHLLLRRLGIMHLFKVCGSCMCRAHSLN